MFVTAMMVLMIQHAVEMYIVVFHHSRLLLKRKTRRPFAMTLKASPRADRAEFAIGSGCPTPLRVYHRCCFGGNTVSSVGPAPLTVSGPARGEHRGAGQALRGTNLGETWNIVEGGEWSYEAGEKSCREGGRTRYERSEALGRSLNALDAQPATCSMPKAARSVSLT